MGQFAKSSGLLRQNCSNSTGYHDYSFVSKLSSISSKISVTEGWRCAQLC